MTTTGERASITLRALAFGSVAAIAVVSVWGAAASPTVITGFPDAPGSVRAALDAQSSAMTPALVLMLLTQAAAALGWLLIFERRRTPVVRLADLLRDRETGWMAPTFLGGPLVFGVAFGGHLAQAASPDGSVLVVAPAAAAWTVALSFAVWSLVSLAAEAVRRAFIAVRAHRRAASPSPA
jgi:hypothetical protein